METFRIFCICKKRTKPAGWFDPGGEPEHISKEESGGQSRCPPTLYKLWRTGRSHFFCFISWHISCLCCFSPLVVYAGTLPQSLIAKTRPVLTIFRKLGRNHSAFFVSAKNEPNPKGGSTPEGSLSISAKLKAEGNQDFAF